MDNVLVPDIPLQLDDNTAYQLFTWLGMVNCEAKLYDVCICCDGDGDGQWCTDDVMFVVEE